MIDFFLFVFIYFILFFIFFHFANTYINPHWTSIFFFFFFLILKSLILTCVPNLPTLVKTCVVFFCGTRVGISMHELESGRGTIWSMKWGNVSPQELSSVHGILQARILAVVAIPFSKGSSGPRDQTQVSRNAGGWILYHFSHQGALTNYNSLIRVSIHLYWNSFSSNLGCP